MRPLYIVGTQRDVGKTTMSIGLISEFRRRGLKVAYTKPLGQRISDVEGQIIHDDAMVVSRATGMTSAESVAMAVPITRGRVEQEIQDLRGRELAERVKAACDKLAEDHDIVVIEGMGHVAMGACVGVSAAEVACVTGATTMIVSGGGIGRAIDTIALCGTFLTARGARLTGAIVNKVWPQKYTRILQATSKGLTNIGITPLGTVPYEEILACPTIQQVVSRLGGEVLCGEGALETRVLNTVVAAMEAEHMVNYLKDGSLVITPGDRSDNIMAVLSMYVLGDHDAPAVSGLMLTGGFRPCGKVMELIEGSHIPTVLYKEDTYTIASKLRGAVFKITPDDKDRISAALCLVSEYVDVEAILESLRE